MNPSAYRYSLDPTGLNPDNLVINEHHDTTANSVRAVAPFSGAFFAESMRVYDDDTDTLLVKDVDYKCVELLQDATLKYGKEISSIVLIVNKNVSSSIRLTYQAIGGQFQYDGSAIANLYEMAIKDGRPVNWEDVNNKPAEYPPALHRHLLEDVYGFEPVVAALERVRSAIILGDVPAFEAVISWVNTRLDQTNATTTAIDQQLVGHVGSENNPHKVNKDQVGLSNVENNATVSAAEIIGATPTHKFVTHDRLIEFSSAKLGNTSNKTVENFVKDHTASEVSSHESKADPHPQYMTSDEVDAVLTQHTGNSDPHPQYMTSDEVDAVLTQHTGNSDPHPQYATDTQLTQEFSNHTSATDPHSQYLTKTNFSDKIGEVGTSNTVKDYIDAEVASVSSETLGIYTYKVFSSGEAVESDLKNNTGLYKNGVKLSGSARSYTVVALSKNTGNVVFSQTYDVMNNGETTNGRNAQTMAVDLNMLGRDVVVVVYTFQEPKNNRLLYGLNEAMYRCGASRSVFGSENFAFKSAYVLVGIPGCGEGNGCEFYQGSEFIDQQSGLQGDPNAFVEVGFQISKGSLVSVGGTGSQFFAYVSKDTLAIKLAGIETDTLKEYIDTSVSLKEPTVSQGTSGDYYRGDKTWQPLNKSSVGLDNVDNTSDANKPVSTATQTALNGKENTGVALQAVAAHEEKNDPHPQYSTPVGLVGLFYNQTPPTGWLQANGQEVSRTTYGQLFSVIGTAAGVGDGTTTFNLPNLQNDFPASLTVCIKH